jgi:hypothetical protein
MTMDATTKERMKHAAEVLTWAADGKEFVFENGTPPNNNPETWILCVFAGRKYRLKPAKTRRPLTEQESQALLGGVVVNGDGLLPALVTVQWGAESLAHAAKNGWHYHFPGDPDNLKPCWVEE